MQLIRRAANGNYSKLLEATIANYLVASDNLSTVRGQARAFVINTQLCAFYGVYVPSVEPLPDEEAWVLQLRNDKPVYVLHDCSAKFSELQLTAYMAGAIDFMLECPEAFGDQCERFFRLAETKAIKKEAAEFLIQMWGAGFGWAKKQFESR